LIIDMQEAMRPVIWRFEQLAERIAGLVLSQAIHPGGQIRLIAAAEAFSR